MYKSIRRRCNQNKCITRKIRKNKAKTVHFSRHIKHRRSISIITISDVDKYFDCYNINITVKNLCKKWILIGGGCNLDYSQTYCGTIYLSKTKKMNFYNHIHLFPSSDNLFNWHDKRSEQYGEFSKSIDHCIHIFKKLLSK
jgi:hypothetical protein